MVNILIAKKDEVNIEMKLMEGMTGVVDVIMSYRPYSLSWVSVLTSSTEKWK